MARKNFLLGLLTTFKVTETVIFNFKKIRWKNITNMAVVLDVILLCKKVLYFYNWQTTILNKVIKLLIFGLLSVGLYIYTKLKAWWPF